MSEQNYKSENNWAGRSLTNYKSMQSGVAASKKVSHELENAKTLTQARKIVYGTKRGQLK